MTKAAHQIITRAIGGTVAVRTIRDPGDGSAKYTISYQNRGGAEPWLCKHRFQDLAQADAGCLVLGDFLDAEIVG
jgi:hypothetical protein